jgi:hypothetical protein
LLRSGEFLKESLLDDEDGGDGSGAAPKAISLSALREALKLKKLKEKKEAAKQPDVKIPGCCCF